MSRVSSGKQVARPATRAARSRSPSRPSAEPQRGHEPAEAHQRLRVVGGQPVEAEGVERARDPPARGAGSLPSRARPGGQRRPQAVGVERQQHERGRDRRARGAPDGRRAARRPRAEAMAGEDHHDHERRPQQPRRRRLAPVRAVGDLEQVLPRPERGVDAGRGRRAARTGAASGQRVAATAARPGRGARGRSRPGAGPRAARCRCAPAARGRAAPPRARRSAVARRSSHSANASRPDRIRNCDIGSDTG